MSQGTQIHTSAQAQGKYDEPTLAVCSHHFVRFRSAMGYPAASGPRHAAVYQSFHPVWRVGATTSPGGDIMLNPHHTSPVAVVIAALPASPMRKVDVSKDNSTILVVSADLERGRYTVKIPAAAAAALDAAALVAGIKVTGMTGEENDATETAIKSAINRMFDTLRIADEKAAAATKAEKEVKAAK